MVSLPDLHKQLPEASLPPSLGGSLLPSRIVTATAGASAQESQVKAMNRRLPRAPPRNRTPVRQSSLSELTMNTVVSCDQQENGDTPQHQTGAVNRIKDLFEQKQEGVAPVRRMAPDQEKHNRHHTPASTGPPRSHPPLKPSVGGAGIENTTSSKQKALPPPPPTRDKPAVSNRTPLSRSAERNEERFGGLFSGRRRSADGKMFTKVTGKVELEERKSVPGESERRLSPTKTPFFGRGLGTHVAEETSSVKKTEDSSKKSSRFKVPFSVLTKPGREGSPPPAAVKSVPNTTPLLPPQSSSGADDGYETVEFKPLQPSPHHTASSLSAAPSQRPAHFKLLPNTPSTSSTSSTSCRQKPKQASVCQDTAPAESKPLPSVPSQPRAPPRRQYENVFIKQRPQGK